MRTTVNQCVYQDLSGDTKLIAQAFPDERDEIRDTIAMHASEVDRRDDGSVYRWILNPTSWDEAVRPWANRLAELEDDAHQIVYFHGMGYAVLVEDGAEPLPSCNLPQVYLERVLDESAQSCVLRLTNGLRRVDKAVNRLDGQQHVSGKIKANITTSFRDEALAGTVAARMVEKHTLPLDPNVKMFIDRIEGADGGSQKDMLEWLGVAEVSPESAVVLTNDLKSGLGFSGSGQAVYRVTMLDGRRMLVVEQIASYTEGYVTDYTFIQDISRM